MVKNRVRNRRVGAVIVCQEFRPALELVRRIETGHVAVRVRREPHVGRHGAAYRRVAPAKGVLEPEGTPNSIAGRILAEKATVRKLPDVRRQSGIAFQHLVKDTALERFAHDEHDVVGLFRLVFMSRSATVHREFQSIGATCSKILRQEGIQLAHQFFGDFRVVVNEFERLDRSDMQYRRGKRVLTERKTHVDLRVRHRDFDPPAGTRKEQHEGNERERHTDGKHHAGNFPGSGFPCPCAVVEHEGATLPAEPKRVGDYKGDCARKAKHHHRNPKDCPEQVATQRRNRRGIGDVRNVKIRAQEGIRKPLVRKAEHVVVRNRHKEVERIENGKPAGRARKPEEARHGKHRAKRHENLPEGLALEHFCHREPERVRQAIEKHQQDALHQQGDKCHRKVGVLQQAHNYTFKIKSTACSRSSTWRAWTCA